MKKTKDRIIACSYTNCSRGNLCPNFTPRPAKNSYSFPSCMYNPLRTIKSMDTITSASK